MSCSRRSARRTAEAAVDQRDVQARPGRRDGQRVVVIAAEGELARGLLEPALLAPDGDRAAGLVVGAGAGWVGSEAAAAMSKGRAPS